VISAGGYFEMLAVLTPHDRIGREPLIAELFAGLGPRRQRALDERGRAAACDAQRPGDCRVVPDAHWVRRYAGDSGAGDRAPAACRLHAINLCKFDLAQADAVRRDLDALVLAQELERLIE
jgi:hypothetical protein